MIQGWIDEVLEIIIVEEFLVVIISLVMKFILVNDSSFIVQVVVGGKVYGRVIDFSGYFIVGVIVKLKGINQGIIFDVNGNFVLKIGGNWEFVVDYIGYEFVMFLVDMIKSLLIVMNED